LFAPPDRIDSEDPEEPAQILSGNAVLSADVLGHLGLPADGAARDATVYPSLKHRVLSQVIFAFFHLLHCICRGSRVAIYASRRRGVTPVSP
jgi:hypothetical protein